MQQANTTRNPAVCTAHCGTPPAKRAPRARLRTRAIVAAVVALLLATMVYGENWLLEAPATACVECAVTYSVARALDGDTVEK